MSIKNIPEINCVRIVAYTKSGHMIFGAEKYDEVGEPIHRESAEVIVRDFLKGERKILDFECCTDEVAYITLDNVEHIRISARRLSRAEALSAVGRDSEICPACRAENEECTFADNQIPCEWQYFT